jgi:hypothetical protein
MLLPTAVDAAGIDNQIIFVSACPRLASLALSSEPCSVLYLRRLSSSQRSAMTTLIGIVLNAKERALLVQALGCYLQHVTRQFPTDEIAARECIELARRLRNARRTDQ